MQYYNFGIHYADFFSVFNFKKKLHHCGKKMFYYVNNKEAFVYL